MERDKILQAALDDLMAGVFIIDPHSPNDAHRAASREALRAYAVEMSRWDHAVAREIRTILES